MTAIEFLRWKGILGETKTKKWIPLNNGNHLDLVQLLEEFKELPETTVS